MATISGTEGGDSLLGTADAEPINGLGGDDTIFGNGGANVIYGDGGNGYDLLDYTDASAAISVNLATGVVTGGSGNDVFSNFEVVFGSAFNDTLIGHAGDNDSIDGGAGWDSLYGGDGNDTLLGCAGGGHQFGGAGNDSLVGGADGDYLQGDAGNDTMLGGDDGDSFVSGLGDDSIVGDAGSDWVFLYEATGGIVASLLTGTATSVSGTTAFANIENLHGSNYDNLLIGDASANALDGGAGNDTMLGGDSDDFIGSGSGNDSIGGGAGSDTVNFSASTSIMANLATGTSTGVSGTTTLTNIENLRGTFYDDQLTGDPAADTLRGSFGNDTLTGGAGDDQIRGDSGTDTVVFSGNFADYTITYDSANMRFMVVDYGVKVEERCSELARAERRIVDTDLRMRSLESDCRQQAGDQLKVTAARLSEIEQELRKSNDASSRQVIVAPASGTVIDLKYSAPGSVIPPRETVADIVPDDTRLVTEARIRLEGVNRVQPGPAAELRFTAFKYRTTLLVRGTVVYISADRLVDRATNVPYYSVLVEADPDSLKTAGEMKLQAGMPAAVYINGEQRTPLQYLVEPVTQVLRRAARER